MDLDLLSAFQVYDSSKSFTILVTFTHSYILYIQRLPRKTTMLMSYLNFNLILRQDINTVLL